MYRELIPVEMPNQIRIISIEKEMLKAMDSVVKKSSLYHTSGFKEAYESVTASVNGPWGKFDDFETNDQTGLTVKIIKNSGCSYK